MLLQCQSYQHSTIAIYNIRVGNFMIAFVRQDTGFKKYNCKAKFWLSLTSDIGNNVMTSEL